MLKHEHPKPRGIRAREGGICLWDLWPRPPSGPRAPDCGGGEAHSALWGRVPLQMSEGKICSPCDPRASVPHNSLPALGQHCCLRRRRRAFLPFEMVKNSNSWCVSKNHECEAEFRANPSLQLEGGAERRACHGAPRPYKQPPRVLETRSGSQSS